MREDITGVVLAGGEGRRMGGVDKGLQPLRGRPLVDWVVAALRPQVATLLVSANRNPERYVAYGEVVADRVGGYAGPLAGLDAALARARTPLVLAAPCDSPFLPADLAIRLAEALAAAAADVAVPRAGGRTHRAFALLRRDLAPGLAAFLAGGGRRLADWHGGLRLAEVDFPDAEAFANINSADELARLAAP